MGLFTKDKKEDGPGVINASQPASRPAIRTGDSSDDTLTPRQEPLTKKQIKRATRTRLMFALFSSFCLLVALVFLILVELGQTYDRAVLRGIYFMRFDFSNIIPTTLPNAFLVNSVARTLGLHDFYQVGLWGYCEGYIDEGVTGCTDPELLYWFNPLDIIRSNLLAGATSMPREMKTEEASADPPCSKRPPTSRRHTRSDTNSLAMDVRPLSRRRMSRLRHALHDTDRCLQPLGCLGNQHLHLLRCTLHNCSHRHRNSDVPHR